MSFVQNNTFLDLAAAIDNELQRNIRYPVTSLAGNFVFTTLDRYAVLDATASARTATLPTAVGNAGMRFGLKKADASSNTVTLLPSLGETIDGASSVVLLVQNEAVEVVSDGSNWKRFVSSAGAGIPGLRTNRTVSVSGALLTSDQVVFVNASAGPIGLSLPNPSLYALRTLTVKKIDATANIVVISSFAAETVDGVSAVALADQYQSVDLYCDGVNWHIL